MSMATDSSHRVIMMGYFRLIFEMENNYFLTLVKEMWTSMCSRGRDKSVPLYRYPRGHSMNEHVTVKRLLLCSV